MTDDIYETPSTTPDFKTELAARLAELVPEAVADGKVDVVKLQELLASERLPQVKLVLDAIEGPVERRRSLAPGDPPVALPISKGLVHSTNFETGLWLLDSWKWPAGRANRRRRL